MRNMHFIAPEYGGKFAIAQCKKSAVQCILFTVGICLNTSHTNVVQRLQVRIARIWKGRRILHLSM
jgi:hypothetical protein